MIETKERVDGRDKPPAVRVDRSQTQRGIPVISPGLRNIGSTTPINGPNVEQALRDALDTREPRVVRLLVRTWNAQADAIKFEDLRDAMLRGDIDPDFILQWHDDYIEFINERLTPHWAAMLEEGSDFMAARVARIAAGEFVPFDELADRLDSWITTRGAELAVDFTNSQRTAVRSVIQHFTVTEPVTATELGRILRPVIGLTPGHAEAVRRFQTLLLEEGLPRATVLRRTINYANRLRRVRAQQIARTELAFAFNQGAYEQVREAQEKELITEPVVKEWLTAQDERVCFCAGTLIATEHGEQPIESIRPFSRVFAPNGQLKRVLTVSSQPYGKGICAIATESGWLLVTEDHPIWADDRWYAARSLLPGMSCQSLNNKPVRINCVLKFSVAELCTVYDLTVEGGELIAGGVRVHNCPFCEPLDGTIIGFDENFPGATKRVPAVLTPPAHPACRCTILYRTVDEDG